MVKLVINGGKPRSELTGSHTGNGAQDTGDSLDLAGDKLGHSAHIGRFD